MEAELLQQVAREWLGRPLDEATKTARRLAALLAELRTAERSAAEPAFRFDPGPSGAAGWVPQGHSTDETVGRAGQTERSPNDRAGQTERSPDGQVSHAGRPPSTASSPLDLSMVELVRLINEGRSSNEGRLSAALVTNSALARIGALDPAVNAFVARLPERAMAQAEAVDRAIRSGASSGPLAGVPVALKDLIDVAGVPTTACSPMRAQAVAVADSVMTSRLAKAGAVLLGKTATHEWAYGTTCDSRLHGSTHNPVSLAHSPGGSSGGSAAAVAAGMVLGALGTDTAGSIRIPAACCGVVGFKPTFGRVSRTGVLPLSHSLDHVGPIARSVADVALLYRAIADEGQSEGWGQVRRKSSGTLEWISSDPQTSLATAFAASSTPLAGLRIGLPEAWLSGPMDPGVAARFQAALTCLQGVGAQLITVELPSLALGQFIGRILTLAEGAAVHAGNLDRLSEYPPDVRARIELGQFILARDYLMAQQLRTRYGREMAESMAGVDLLITPTQPIPAPLLEQRLWTYEGGDQEAVADALTRFVAPANVTGQPAISLPCGRTPAGLPVGLQLMGHPHGDATLLGIAALIEEALGGQMDD